LAWCLLAALGSGCAWWPAPDPAQGPPAPLPSPSAPTPAGTWPDLSHSADAAAREDGGERDAALVIGVTDYAYVPDIPGAARNAEDWFAYLVQVRGVPLASARLLRDHEATREAIEDAARDVTARVQPGGTLWVVFIGHGAPSPDGQQGVLIGADAQARAASLYARSVSQRQLADLTQGPQAHSVWVIDACFSGQSASGAPLLPGLQPLVPVRAAPALGGVTALYAAAADEFAGSLPGLDRPAFSYLTLGALRGWGDLDGDGQVTAAEAISYTAEALAITARDRRQTPALSGPPIPLSRPHAPLTPPNLLTIQLHPSPAPPSPPTPPASPASPLPDGAEDMAAIPGGTWQLGCDPTTDRGCEADARPVRAVTLSPFWIDRHEVTVDHYRACVRAGACKPPRGGGYCTWDQAGGGDLPLTCVTWDQAQTYCAWRGKRLPTEAEWERAARGPLNHPHPWGDAPPSCAVATLMERGFGCGRHSPAPVGSKPEGASPEGVHDLLGNAAEWVADWYHASYDTLGPHRDPSGPDKGTRRVVRGGSFIDSARALHAARRASLQPSRADYAVGFRCAR
jgi:iron(II)-dependent oxidoreductase